MRLLPDYESDQLEVSFWVDFGETFSSKSVPEWGASSEFCFMNLLQRKFIYSSCLWYKLQLHQLCLKFRNIVIPLHSISLLISGSCAIGWKLMSAKYFMKMWTYCIKIDMIEKYYIQKLLTKITTIQMHWALH